jgi:hypothetical protein
LLTCELNSPGTDEEYLRAVNVCFPGWGDHRQLAWVLNRSVGGPVPDRMLLRLSGTLVAGSAVSYRWLQRAGTRVLIGIMTGSWTLPEARGQGCFTRIIQESVKVAANQGAALLLAFVTEDNPSYRRLQDAGAALFSTTYFQSQGVTAGASALAVEEVVLDGALEARLHARHIAPGEGEVGVRRWSVVYDLDSWRGQLVERARRSTTVRIGDHAFALLDRVPESTTTRLLSLYPGGLDLNDLLRTLADGLSAKGQTLVGFAADPELAEAARGTGLACKPGYLTALVADPAALGMALGLTEPWAGRDLDLADPDSPWFIGGFGFQAGDRM